MLVLWSLHNNKNRLEKHSFACKAFSYIGAGLNIYCWACVSEQCKWNKAVKLLKCCTIELNIAVMKILILCRQGW